MTEIWKPVPYKLYAKSYEVSNLGRIRSVDRTVVKSNGVTAPVKGRMLKPRQIKLHYTVELCSSIDKSRVRRTSCLSRLVAECFVNRPPNTDCVIHIDRDYSNNAASNLKWVSQSYINSRRIQEHPHLRNIIRDINIEKTTLRQAQ